MILIGVDESVEDGDIFISHHFFNSSLLQGDPSFVPEEDVLEAADEFEQIMFVDYMEASARVILLFMTELAAELAGHFISGLVFEVEKEVVYCEGDCEGDEGIVEKRQEQNFIVSPEGGAPGVELRKGEVYVVLGLKVEYFVDCRSVDGMDCDGEEESDGEYEEGKQD